MVLGYMEVLIVLIFIPFTERADDNWTLWGRNIVSIDGWICCRVKRPLPADDAVVTVVAMVDLSEDVVVDLIISKVLSFAFLRFEARLLTVRLE